jgi:16S rRNA (adenine1518-N6/adenine1519-N6)-dimethyltransferase
MAMPMTPTQTSSLLRDLEHRPRKNLGQNFLVDANIVEKSLTLGQVSPDDQIVEIGPGLGTLTESLLEKGANVWAVEFDATLAAHLREKLQPKYPDALKLLEGDAIEFPRANFNEPNHFKVVANLPYAISTPWLDAMLQYPLASRMVLMLQLEAADRFAAKPGTKQFGAISIFIQSVYDIESGHRVPAACFHPRPEVESFLFNICLKPTPFLFPTQTKKLIRECFQQRRKQIGALLKKKLADGGEKWIRSLSAEGLDHRARPEQIPVTAWQRLEVNTPPPDQLN